MPHLNGILSTHLFLFPFRWDIIPSGKMLNQSSYDDRTRLFSSSAEPSFENLLLNDTGNWKREPFSIETGTHLDYNQYQYFFEFVRGIAFDSESSTNPIMRTYHFQEGENLRYKIFVEKDSDSTVEYNLKIDKIQLNAYDVGVGILSFHLCSDEETFKAKKNFDSSDILLINDSGRRVYPPFLGDNFSVNTAKSAFLARKIILEKNGNILFASDFEHNYAQSPDYLPPHIINLFGNNFFTSIVNDDNTINSPKIKVNTLIDDRMFVLCWLADNSEITNINGYHINSEYDKKFDFWQKLVFVDGKDPSSPDTFFAKELLAKVTYTRWLPYSTLLGVSRYSFVILSSVNDFSINVLKKHLSTIYFQMLQMTLLQRATIIRFSSEITRISMEIDKYEKKMDFNTISNEIRTLYKNYIQFRNQIHFREVTAQEQGIELYDMIQNTMRIETHIKELDAEIDELHRYVKMIDDSHESDRINNLTKMAAAFGVVSLIISYFGYGLLTFPKYELSISETQGIFVFILILLGMTVVYFFPDWLPKWKNKDWLRVISIILSLGCLCLPLLLMKPPNPTQTKLINTDSINKAEKRITDLKIDSLKLEIKKMKNTPANSGTTNQPKRGK
jgi:hypothetical protein